MSVSTERFALQREDAAGGAVMRALIFAIGQDEVAVDVLRVREVVRREEVTPVPGLPAAVRGIAALHGGAVPVLDLAVRFGRAPSAPGPRSCIVVVEAEVGGEAVDVGLLADDVRRVVPLGAADIEPAPLLNKRLRLDFLSAIARVSGRVVFLLDVEQLLDSLDGEAVAAMSPAAAPASAAAAAEAASIAPAAPVAGSAGASEPTLPEGVVS